jgi:hypothetical protein
MPKNAAGEGKWRTAVRTHRQFLKEAHQFGVSRAIGDHLRQPVWSRNRDGLELGRRARMARQGVGSSIRRPRLVKYLIL